MIRSNEMYISMNTLSERYVTITLHFYYFASKFVTNYTVVADVLLATLFFMPAHNIFAT